jgi:hypothetical protein
MVVNTQLAFKCFPEVLIEMGHQAGVGWPGGLWETVAVPKRAIAGVEWVPRV